MASLRELVVRVSADTQIYRTEMKRAERTGADYHRTMQSNARRFDAAMRQNQRSLRELTNHLEQVRKTALTVGAGFASIFAVKNTVAAADSWGQYAARMRMAINEVGESADKYAVIQDRLMTISQRNAKNIEDSQELYIRTASSMRDLGYSTAQTVDFIESVSASLTINAASAQSTESAINALSKSMINGRVSANEWRSLMQAMPTLVNDLAKSTGKTEQEIKALGQSGKISMHELANASIMAKDANNALADSMDNTVADGITKVNNAFKQYIGEANQTHRVTARMAEALGYLAENMDTVATAGGAIVAVGTARYLGKMSHAAYNATKEVYATSKANLDFAKSQLAAARQSVISANADVATAHAKVKAATTAKRQEAAERSLTKALAQKTAAINAVRTAQERANAMSSKAALAARAAQGALGFIGGPAGAAMLAGGALLYFSDKARQAKEDALNLGDKVRGLGKDFSLFTEKQMKAEDARLGKQIKNAEKQLEEAEKVITALEANVMSKKGVKDSMLSFFFDEDSLKTAENDLAIALENHEKIRDGLLSAYGRKEDVGAHLNFVGPTQPQKVVERNAKNDEEHEKHLTRLQRELGLVGAVTEAAKTKFEVEFGAYKNLQPEQQQSLINAAKLLDLARERQKYTDHYDNTVKRLEHQKAVIGEITELEKVQGALKREEFGQLRKEQAELIEAKAKELDLANKQHEQKEKFTQLMKDCAPISQQLTDAWRDKLEAIKAATDSTKNYANSLKLFFNNEFLAQDPLVNLQTELDAKKEMLNAYFEEMKVLEIDVSQEVALAKEQIEADYNQKKMEVLERQFREQSEWNNLSLNMIDTFGSQATSAITGLITGTTNAREAMRGLATAILNQAVGALVQMGIQQVKTALITKATQKAAAAGYAGAVTAQSTAQTALAGQAAYASTAAIPVVGPAAAPAAAATAVKAAAIFGTTATSAASSMVGMAHSGIDYVPREGTWLLDRGERVVDARTNEDLKRFLNDFDAVNEIRRSTRESFNNEVQINTSGGSGHSGIDNAIANMKECTQKIMQNHEPRAKKPKITIINNGNSEVLQPRQMDDETIIEIAAERGQKKVAEDLTNRYGPVSDAMRNGWNTTSKAD